MIEKDPNQIDRLRDLVPTISLKTPLARWMSRHHAEFSELLSEHRLQWEGLIEWWCEERVLDLPADWTSDDPQIRTAARKKATKKCKRVWQRVKKAREKDRGKRSTSRPPPAQAPGQSTLNADTPMDVRNQLRARMKPVTIPNKH